MALALHGVPENFEGKGLTVARGWFGDKAPSGPPRRIGITYNRKSRDEGLVFNFCPFCGTRIRFDE